MFLQGAVIYTHISLHVLRYYAVDVWREAGSVQIVAD
jgi:hypothetical protein